MDTAAETATIYEALGDDATYTAPGGSAVTTKAIVDPALEDVSGELGLQRKLYQVSLLQADVPSPERDGVVVVTLRDGSGAVTGTDTYVIEKPLEADGREVVVLAVKSA